GHQGVYARLRRAMGVSRERDWISQEPSPRRFAATLSRKRERGKRACGHPLAFPPLFCLSSYHAHPLFSPPRIRVVRLDPVTLEPLPEDGEPFMPPRPRGSRRPHTDGKVSAVRQLVEQTRATYAEIAKRTGVAPASICRWTRDGSWVRPLFAPRATDTVPRFRASAKLRRRSLASRLTALAKRGPPPPAPRPPARPGRGIRELEAAPAVDLARLREALELLKMTKLAERPRRRWQGRRAKASPPLDAEARARVIADLRANGVDIARAPGEALADFIESTAPGRDPMDHAALRPPKRRYSMRKRGHVGMMERDR